MTRVRIPNGIRPVVAAVLGFTIQGMALVAKARPQEPHAIAHAGAGDRHETVAGCGDSAGEDQPLVVSPHGPVERQPRGLVAE